MREAVGCQFCDEPIAKDFSSAYMVKDKIWELTGLPKAHKDYFVEAHLKCLEKKIGRQLTPDDFTDCYLNRMNGHIK